MSVNLLGKRLHDLREQYGLTQTELTAELRRRYNITVRQSHISNLEQGTKLPSLPLLVALANTLETSTDYLLGITDNQLSYQDMDEELRAGGGQLDRLMARLSEDKRNELLSIAEAYIYRNMMEFLLDKVHEVGGEAAVDEVIERLEASMPGTMRRRWRRGASEQSSK